MAHELPYTISKGAIHQMTLTLSDALMDRGITVNTVNPGPTDTGWATPRLFDQVRSALPAGRWGSVDDVARLVAWLASDDSAWITGQVLKFRGWISSLENVSTRLRHAMALTAQHRDIGQH